VRERMEWFMVFFLSGLTPRLLTKNSSPGIGTSNILLVS
jgi:hypothetical protein